MLVRKIGFLLFEDFTALDIAGPLEAFNSVAQVSDCRYESVIVGINPGLVYSESGISMYADYGLADIPQLDTLVIPGGTGARNQSTINSIKPWLKKSSHSIRRIVSICTGSFILAQCGLLDEYPSTTHWSSADLFTRTFPKLTLIPDALFIDNGRIATSAGIVSGIDLSLKLIENDLGSDIAAKVARYLVVHYRRAGDQAQFSEPLQYQAKADSRFSSLTGWMLQNLSKELSLALLAEHSGMSVRNFCRKFQAAMGQSPAKYVESLRLDYARQLLTEKDWHINRIATACGYQNVDVFRRAFHRRFGISPKTYCVNFKVKTKC